MQVISYLTAVVQRPLSHDEFLPVGESSLAPFVADIIQQYEFQNNGEMQAPQANSGAPLPIFQTGVFNFKGRRVPILSLELHPTRITAACSTTEQAIAFSDAFVEFLVKKHGFRRPQRAVKDFFASSMVVDFGDRFSKIFGVFSEVGQAINAAGAGMLTTPMEWTSLRFNGVGTKDGTMINNSFLLEQRGGRPASTNWLFTQAPLTNDAHVKLLAAIEEIFIRVSAV